MQVNKEIKICNFYISHFPQFLKYIIDIYIMIIPNNS